MRGGSGRLGASIMAQVPSVDPELGCSGSMVLARGRVNGGHRRKAACGGFGRHRRSGEAQGFILYLIKAGLLPVRFKPPIGRAVGRWPEGEGGGL